MPVFSPRIMSVRSVLEQTQGVHEIIVVDDGSKAEHRTEIDHTVSLSPSIRLLRLPESAGAGTARNAGLDLATGDAVLFLDDDDLLHPHMVETGLSILEREPRAGVSTCLYEMFFTPDGEGPWISAALLFNYRILDRHPLRLIEHTDFAPRSLLERRPFSAFLRRPSLFIMDEPSANLDEATEVCVVAALRELKGRCTVLVVSHRKGILKEADSIHHMEAVQTTDGE